MFKKCHLFLLLLLFFPLNLLYAAAHRYNDCTDSTYLMHHPHLILPCAKTTLPIKPIQSIYIGQHETNVYTVYKYLFSSLSWPKFGAKQDSITPATWDHEIDIFVPKEKTIHDTALLYIAGGSNHRLSDAPEGKYPTRLMHKFLKHSVVVILKYVPNQYLNINGKQLKEDQIVAFTWNRFINNPALSYYPLHIPMAIAAQQTMTLVQHVLYEKQVAVNHFVVMGVSKRAWATWMIALLDSRVVAIMPIVIDILNMQQQIPHMYAVYGNHWPIAFNDYYQQHITEYIVPHDIHYKNYLKLLQVEDPFTYLSVPDYQKRIANIQKYIINASGDDFFLPDASRYYYSALPGEKLLFYVPNASHYIQNTSYAKQLSVSLFAFYQRIVQRIPLPTVTWKKNKENILTIYYSEKPKNVILWSAQNPTTRDFRYACGIQYRPTNLIFSSGKASAKIQAITPGWQATFITIEFPDGLQTSTPIFISPDAVYPNTNQIMPQKNMCRLIGIK